MVLTKSELLASLQNEVRILLHLASKVDRSQLDYRPTPKQRSTIDLLRYLSMIGPTLVKYTLTGSQDSSIWADAAKLADASDTDLRVESASINGKTSRGSTTVNLVLCGCAAYRTQLFLYLKACGREELSTMNLWAGMDAPAATA